MRRARPTHIFLALVLIGSSPACGTGGGADAPAEVGAVPGGGGVGAGGSAPFPTPTGGSADTGGAAGAPTFMTPVPVVESCAQAAYQSALLPTNLLFVVDRSGSMNCNLPPITDSAACEKTATTADLTQPTKWSVITSAMTSAVQALAALPGTSMGLSLFSVDDECGVRSAPTVGLAPLSPAQIDGLTNTLRSETPGGGTPLIGSIVLGYKYLHQTARAPGNRFLVVVTDGSDSCLGLYAQEGVTGDVMSRLLDTEIPKAISVNIRTFVIGAPGSEASRGLLSRIAFAGGTATRADCDHTSADPAPGTACHFDMTTTSDFALDLSAALKAITGDSAAVCEFEVPKPTGGAAVDPTKVNVDYYKAGDPSDASRIQLYRDDTKPCDGGAEGWQYTPDQSKIRICGPVCDQVKADAQAKVIVSLGCEQRVIH